MTAVRRAEDAASRLHAAAEMQREISIFAGALRDRWSLAVGPGPEEGKVYSDLMERLEGVARLARATQTGAVDELASLDLSLTA